MKKIIYVLGLISILLLVVACGNVPANKSVVTEKTAAPIDNIGATPAPAVTDLVIIENFKFMPADLEINVGDTVEWTNKDSAEHTVTFDNGEFDGKLPQGGSATFTFEQKGEYKYYCAFHPGMQGKILVS